MLREGCVALLYVLARTHLNHAFAVYSGRNNRMLLTRCFSSTIFFLYSMPLGESRYAEM